MSRVALGSLKASPGVTTTAVALGATWPAGRPVTVVEADPSGGDLAARYNLAAEPSLLTLAAAARRDTNGTSEHVLADNHVQRLPGGLAVLAGPASADQAHAALRMLGPTAPALTAIEGDLLVDCGRLDSASPALRLAAACELLVLVARPVLAELHHLAARVDALRELTGQVAVVLIGPGRYPPGEVTAALDVEVLATLPDDRHGAGLLAGQPGPARLLERLALVGAARSLTQTICARLDASPDPSARRPDRQAATAAPVATEDGVLVGADPVGPNGRGGSR